MIAPSVIACAPCFVIADPDVAFLATTGTLAFYTFLLLPTALRFDFRRDLDRLATLKGLPITPAAAAIGQTLAPVLIATLFQSGVLAFAVAARSLPPHQLFMAMLVMIPLNVLVFGLDNLIFLLYPYRMQQEGLEIFLRHDSHVHGQGPAVCRRISGDVRLGRRRRRVDAWNLTLDRKHHQCAHRVRWRHDRRSVVISGARALRIMPDLSQHEPD